MTEHLLSILPSGCLATHFVFVLTYCLSHSVKMGSPPGVMYTEPFLKKSFSANDRAKVSWPCSGAAIERVATPGPFLT